MYGTGKPVPGYSSPVGIPSGYSDAFPGARVSQVSVGWADGGNNPMRASMQSAFTAGSAGGGVVPASTFTFQERVGRIDMARLASVDIDRVVRLRDIDTLQDHLQNITFGKLTRDELHSYSEDQIIKLFELAQLTMEYLLSVQGALATTDAQLRQQCAALQEELVKQRQRAAKEARRRQELKKEVKLRKHTLVQVKAFLDEARPQNVAYNVGHRCRQCGNYYQTVEQRDRHVARRHGPKPAHSTPTQPTGGSGKVDDALAQRLHDLEVQLKHQRELAAVEAASRQREVERMESELKRAREASEHAAAAQTQAVMAAESAAVQRLQQALDAQRDASLHREQELQRQLQEQAEEVKRVKETIEAGVGAGPASPMQPRGAMGGRGGRGGSSGGGGGGSDNSHLESKVKQLADALEDRNDELERLQRRVRRLRDRKRGGGWDPNVSSDTDEEGDVDAPAGDVGAAASAADLEATRAALAQAAKEREEALAAQRAQLEAEMAAKLEAEQQERARLAEELEAERAGREASMGEVQQRVAEEQQQRKAMAEQLAAVQKQLRALAAFQSGRGEAAPAPERPPSPLPPPDDGDESVGDLGVDDGDEVEPMDVQGDADGAGAGENDVVDAAVTETAAAGGAVEVEEEEEEEYGRPWPVVIPRGSPTSEGLEIIEVGTDELTLSGQHFDDTCKVFVNNALEVRLKVKKVTCISDTELHVLFKRPLPEELAHHRLSALVMSKPQRDVARAQANGDGPQLFDEDGNEMSPTPEAVTIAIVRPVPVLEGMRGGVAPNAVHAGDNRIVLQGEYLAPPFTSVSPSGIEGPGAHAGGPRLDGEVPTVSLHMVPPHGQVGQVPVPVSEVKVDSEQRLVVVLAQPLPRNAAGNALFATVTSCDVESDQAHVAVIEAAASNTAVTRKAKTSIVRNMFGFLNRVLRRRKPSAAASQPAPQPAPQYGVAESKMNDGQLVIDDDDVEDDMDGGRGVGRHDDVQIVSSEADLGLDGGDDDGVASDPDRDDVVDDDVTGAPHDAGGRGAARGSGLPRRRRRRHAADDDDMDVDGAMAAAEAAVRENRRRQEQQRAELEARRQELEDGGGANGSSSSNDRRPVVDDGRDHYDDGPEFDHSGEAGIGVGSDDEGDDEGDAAGAGFDGKDGRGHPNPRGISVRTSNDTAMSSVGGWGSEARGGRQSGAGELADDSMEMQIQSLENEMGVMDMDDSGRGGGAGGLDQSHDGDGKLSRGGFTGSDRGSYAHRPSTAGTMDSELSAVSTLAPSPGNPHGGSAPHSSVQRLRRQGGQGVTPTSAATGTPASGFVSSVGDSSDFHDSPMGGPLPLRGDGRPGGRDVLTPVTRDSGVPSVSSLDDTIDTMALESFDGDDSYNAGGRPRRSRGGNSRPQTADSGYTGDSAYDEVVADQSTSGGAWQ